MRQSTIAWAWVACVFGVVLLLFIASSRSGVSTNNYRTVLLQENLSLLGHEEMLTRAAKRRREIKAGVAIGTGGMGIGGAVPVLPPPPPTISRGGHAWIYDKEYGVGQRPTTSVWCDCDSLAECKEKCGKAEEPEPEPEPEPEEPTPEEPASEDESGVGEQQTVAQDEVEERKTKEEDYTDESASEQPLQEPAEEEESREEEPEELKEPAEPTNQNDAGNGGAGFVLTVPYEGYAPKLPSGRGPPYGGSAGIPRGGFASGGAVGAEEGLGLLPSSWVGEDAAQHALTLAQWRVNILRSKLEQADLTKRLMAASSPLAAEDKAAVRGSEEEEEQDKDGREPGGAREEAHLTEADMLKSHGEVCL
jgi:hypothetical protein